MNASELNRQLLFYGYNEVTDFLKNSPLNRYLYKTFLSVLPQTGIEMPMVSLYNEIYYQCVRVNYDASPGVDIESRYIAEEEEWLKSKSATELIFAIVWVLLRLKRDQTFHEDCFVSQLTPFVEGGAFRELAHTMYTEFRYVGMEVPSPFPTLTCPIDGIPKFEIHPVERRRSLTGLINASIEKNLGLQTQYFELQEHTMAWKTVTCNYSPSVIESYVRLYSKPEDQLELIVRIEKTLPREEIINLDGFFKDLVSRIKTGNFEPEDTLTGQRLKKDYHEPDEQQDLEYNMALYKASCDDEMDVVDELKQERDSLKAQLADQQKSYEMELAKMEAKYKAEIESVRRERNKLAHEPVAQVNPGSDENTKELTLTLSELVAVAKERFSKSGANEFCAMLYGKAVEHHFLDEDTFKQIEGIIPSIIARDKPQNQFDVNTAQINVNPQSVNNYTKEKEND